MLQSLMRDRDAIPADRSLDVRFDDFMADDLAVAAQVYELAGEPLTDEAAAAMKEYLDGHQRGRLGTVATSAEMFGLDRRGAAGPVRAVRRALPRPETPLTTRTRSTKLTRVN